MSRSYYAVKSIYKTYTIGSPKNVDRDYRRRAFLIEERVVLFKARNFDDALLQGEREAVRYCSSYYYNPYGQKVVTKRVGELDAYIIFDEQIKTGTELFSSTILANNEKELKGILKYQNLSEEEGEKSRRRNFFNRDLQYK